MVVMAASDSSSHSHDLNEHHGASFIVVTYGGDRETIVNVDCAILHLLLHLRAKYIGEGFTLKENIQVRTKTPYPLVHKQKCSGSKPSKMEYEEYLDLLDSAASPVELWKRNPMAIARPYLRQNSFYVLCSVKMNQHGLVTDATPLLTTPSVDLQRKINNVLQTIERFKTRVDRRHSFKPENRRKVNPISSRH